MSRVAHQPDLFRPDPTTSPAAPCEPKADPLETLAELLAELRAASDHPWTPLPYAIQQEHRVLALGQLGGSEGTRLAAAVLAESERLFASAEGA